MKKSPAGFSLIEVLIFVTILSLFFIVAITITTFNLRNLKLQEHKILATRYAEEGVEWIKQEKEDDWQVFASHGATSLNYCLNSLDWSTLTDCGSSYTLGPPFIFKRSLIITNSGSPINKATIELTVSWLDNDIVQKVVIKSIVYLWE